MVSLFSGVLNDFLRFILAAFTVYRLAQLFTFELGFFGCVYCVALFISPFVTFAVLCPTIPGDILLTFFGLAGAQSWLQDERRVRMRLEK